jgi:hypothetical protein
VQQTIARERLSSNHYIQIKGFGIVLVVRIRHHAASLYKKGRMANRVSIQQATLQHAKLIAGSLHRLSTAISVPTEDLTKWLDGSEPVPTWVFLRAVDYVNEAESREQRQHPYAPPAADEDRNGHED